jgi:mRNA-degrading endonuclease RelE of RelBE toxin-antitoxin system
MEYTVEKKVFKEFEKLPAHIKVMAFKQMKKLKEAATLGELGNVEHLEGTAEPYYRLKFNDYRLLLYHNENKNNVEVLSLKHRKDAYKKQNLPWK